MSLFEKIIELENRIKSKEDKYLILNSDDKKSLKETCFVVEKLAYKKLSQEHTTNNKLEQSEIK